MKGVAGKSLASFLLFLSFFSLQAQNESNNWALGNYQLDFNSGQPDVKSDYAAYLNRGIGVISDKNGLLLFYSDGFSIWNKNHELMPNGTELIPAHGSTSTQESLVIPDPGNSNLYYLFTVDPYNGQGTSGLYYSVIDLSQDSGLGDITTKGIKILDNTTNKISAVFHENSQDVWLLTHKQNTNNYYSYLITSEGISDVPILNQLGNIHSFWDGQLKFSPDGSKVAVTYTRQIKGLSLFDFDSNTGILSNARDFYFDDISPQSLAFSSDGTKIYTGTSYIYQFDLSIPTFDAILNSKIRIDTRINYNSFRQLQLGPNGKIYATKGGGGGGTAHLGVILNPNSEGKEVVIEENGLFLEGGSSFVNYTPNFIQNYFFKTSFSYENTCQAKPTKFTVTNTHLLESVEWSFGEGSTSTVVNPEFTYEEAGTYTVILAANYSDHTNLITKEVVINPFPNLEVGEDVTKCYGSKLSVDDVFSFYQWHNGDTTSVTTITESGYYVLQVTNMYGCTSKDSLFVDVIELPQINLSDTLYITQGESITVNPGNFDSYSWNTGEATPNIEVVQQGWYSVVVTNQFGCESSKSFYISYGEEEELYPPKWIRLNPKPTSLRGNDIVFVNEKIGFIVNDQELLTTNDQGSTWRKFMTIDYGNRISFIDGYGYIIGATGSIYKSTYNGGGWNKLETSFSENLNGISLLHPDTILITSDNHLFKSFDGGNNWETLEINGVNVEDSYFIDHLVGHVACTNGTILKTQNGGESWYETETTNTIPSDFFRITFINESLGFATQEHHDLYKTTDGGETWIEINSSLDAGYALQFIDENTGFMAGEYGAIHKTTNGGETWNWIGFDGRRGGNNLYDIHFINKNLGFATGLKGRIIKTTNGGLTWNEYSTTYNKINQLDFTSANIGFARVGNEIFKTTNRGLDWSNMGAPLINQKIGQFDFINDLIGFAIAGGGVGTSGNSGSVYKTIDGGISWIKAHDSFELIDENLYSIDFVDENLGFVSGGYNRDAVLKTIDGGSTWTIVESISFGQIQFLNDQVGYARNVGNYYNRIYKTIDGGRTWQIKFEIDKGINSFYFVNESVGYFVGDNALMNKTEDGGETWQELEIPYEYYDYVKFYSINVGYVLDEEGQLYRTVDGGLTWSSEVRIYGISSVEINNNDIFISGDYGSILRSTISYDDLISFGSLYSENLKNTSVTINSSLRSSIDTTYVYFEYGLEEGVYSEVIEDTIFYGFTSQNLDFKFENLAEATQYYCRFYIKDSDNKIASEKFSFTTKKYDDLLQISPLSIIQLSSSSATIAANMISYLDTTDLYIDFRVDGGVYDISQSIELFTGYVDQPIEHLFNGLESSTVYYCRLKVVDGERITVTPEFSFTTMILGINDYDSNSVRGIYPNPADGSIKIEVIDSNNLFEYKIFDITGVLLIEGRSKNNDVVDISSLRSGIYVLKVIQGSKIVTGRLIKQ